MDNENDTHKTYIVDNSDLRCTRCKVLSDGATKASGDFGGPQDGDFAVCHKCGELHQYITTDGLLTFTKFSIDDVQDPLVARDIRFMQNAIVSRNFNMKAAWSPEV